jgi:trimethylamine--corrinoid protein Co-methyltransferase
MIVLCDEIISMLRHFVAGISFDDESMAMDVIHQVGPDGDYLSTKHTLQHFRHMWRPALFSRLGGEAWARAGSKRLGEILREKTLSIIEEHQPEPLDDNVRAEVEYILKNS